MLRLHRRFSLDTGAAAHADRDVFADKGEYFSIAEMMAPRRRPWGPPSRTSAYAIIIASELLSRDAILRS